MNVRTSLGAMTLVFSAISLHADIKVVFERNPNETARPGFNFKSVPAPARDDAATAAKFIVVDGERDGNGGGVDKLNDGRLPSEEDRPVENFFFRAGSDGGRLLLDTFYSEIDVIDRDGAVTAAAPAAEPEPIIITFDAEGGKYQFTIDVSAAPDLKTWAETKLAPVVKEWYPKIVAQLPSDGFEAATRVAIRFRDGMGRTPASAGGSGVNCNIDWFRRNLDGEARGAVVHELVHVVQQYGRARRNNPNATRTPGWLTEGIADYLRWFQYEPETKGAEITARNLARAKYDASYRITGNFLNWVTEKYDRDLVRKLNAAAREGKYHEDLWKEKTGKTVQELGEEWRQGHETRLK